MTGSIYYLDQSHYDTHDYMVKMLNAPMGVGKGWYANREMITRLRAKAEINKRNPALAAEHRVGGMKAERSIALEMKRLRDWKKMNWALYYGMATHRTLEGIYA